jgi:fructose-bisphosphate aldolase, class I
LWLEFLRSGYANEAGCNAYAAPLGFLEAGAREFAGEIPLILKVNDHDALLDEADPPQALTSSVEDALRLGCVAIGFTIYPGSAKRFEMYEQIRAYAAEAKRCGLAVVIWSYARGSGVSTAGETSILWREASPTISLLMLLKLPPSWGHILSKSNFQLTRSNSRLRGRFMKKCRFRWRSLSVKRIATPTERVRHVVQSAFNGRRIVIFSGGATHSDEALLEEVKAIHGGGGFGSIIGRNSFQRSKPDALKLLDSVMEIYSGS